MFYATGKRLQFDRLASVDPFSGATVIGRLK